MPHLRRTITFQRVDRLAARANLATLIRANEELGHIALLLRWEDTGGMLAYIMRAHPMLVERVLREERPTQWRIERPGVQALYYIKTGKQLCLAEFPNVQPPRRTS